MRFLIFCGTRDAIQRFDMEQFKGNPLVRIIISLYPQEQRNETVKWFKETEGAILVVDRCMAQGWRAPADTFVLFDPSWPYDRNSPTTVQAVARRERPGR